MPFQLEITNPSGKRIIAGFSTRASAGKGAENEIKLQGWTVAAHHADFYEKGGGVWVTDSGSSSGTFVNGRKVSEYGPLKVDDAVRIGGYSIAITPANAPVAPVKPASDQAPPRPSPPSRTQPQEPHLTDVPKDKAAQQALFNLQRDIHEEILRRMDLHRVDVHGMSEDQLREMARSLINDVIAEKPIPPGLDREYLASTILNETVGLGPLEGFLADDSISEIMINNHEDIFIERNGRLQRSDVCFSSDKAVMSIIDRVIAPLGRRIDESSPYVDGRLKDGSRFNAIIPPLALKGPSVTIRKFAHRKLTGEDVINYGSMNRGMATLLETAVKNRMNIIISGGTGSGKTTLLNVLSNYIPINERVITVEDAAELKLYHPNLVSLEARPPNIEGKGQVTIRDLVRNCLRMRPDRIVIGECRGGEALDMLQAMNTGHDGSLTTVHANTPRDTLSRLEVMVLMAGMDLPAAAIIEQIVSAVHLIVQQTRFSCGSRKITHITEITGIEQGVAQLQNIFEFKQRGYGPDGKVDGEFIATGAIPEFYQRLRDRGIDLDLSIFKSGKDN